VVEGIVVATPCQEFFVRALFHDTPPVEDDNMVSPPNRGEPMRNNHGGAPLKQRLQRLLDRAFCGGVNAGCGFVQDQDSGVLNKGSGKGQQLSFAHGECLAAFCQHGVQPSWEAPNKSLRLHCS